MSTIITDPSEVPDAPFYVIGIFGLVNGWQNVIILPCADAQEAGRVARYAEARVGIDSVRVQQAVGLFDPGAVYSLFDRETADRWYHKD